MCQFSTNTENTRDARAGEDLVVTEAPHHGGNWLTAPDDPNCAVCVRDTAPIAIQLPNQGVRGANFVHIQQSDGHGNFDFIRFIDGEKELVPLNRIPRGTGARVLKESWQKGYKENQAIPNSIPTTIHVGLGMDEENQEFLVAVGAASSNNRQQAGRRISQFFR